MDSINYNNLVELLPSCEQAIKRLDFLNNKAGRTKVAVFGKYNHGKSSLLNAIIGKRHFKVADKRETIENNLLEHNGIHWIDTPGLDADVHGDDDRTAMQGAFELADFLLLAHSVKTGELDRYELQLYRDLLKQDANYSKKMFLILTQIDQVPEETLDLVVNKIRAQMPELTIIPVSSERYMKGIEQKQDVFKEKSRMHELFDLIGTLDGQLFELRTNETKRIKDKLTLELRDLINAEKKELDSITYLINKKTKKLTNNIEELGRI